MNTQNLSIDPIYTVPEVAAYLKISKAKLYDLIKRKEMPHIRMGRNVRIRESDLNRWLELQVEKTCEPYN